MSKFSLAAALGVIPAVFSAVSASAVEPPIAVISPSRVVALGEPATTGGGSVVSCVAVDPAGKWLAAVGDDHLVRVFRLPGLALSYELPGHIDWGRTAAFRGDGELLATAGDDHRIRFWEASQRPSLRCAPAGQQPIYALAFSPDGQSLAAAGRSDEVRIHHGNSGRLLSVLAAPGGNIRSVGFSPGGRYLAAAAGGTLRIWDASTGEPLRDSTAPQRPIHALAWSPDGKLLAAASGQRSIQLWELTSGRIAADLRYRGGPVRALIFCGPGTLASAGTDNVIRVWDVAAGCQRAQLLGHTGTVSTLAYEPNSGTLVSGSFDNTLRTWPIGSRRNEPASR